MPSFSTVKASNASYAPSYIPTAVFVGGTSGIGQAMAELLARLLNGRVNIIIIGRNKIAGERIIAGFPAPPSGEAKHEFLQCDAGELKNVHEVSKLLLQKLDKINFLVLSPSPNVTHAIPTPEGLELAMVLRYYARVKFMYELLPLLKNARNKGEDARAMTVFAGGLGWKVDLNDLGLKKKWSMFRMTLQTGTYTHVAIKALSEQNPDIAFMHIYPGTVDTPANNIHWIVTALHPVLKHLMWTPADCAENMMYALLKPEFSAGGYWFGRKGDQTTPGSYITEEVIKKVWEHTVEVAQLH
ncbi:hypothetical protein M408DRAFT_326307 [Serendipita vermifera MAFF 305830]|uniref:Ketoreductase (KR) domain-containing protein n=1 Tax=Serendipita vermifera MAFF 305830 TaxID=933852 RepID=A0A0C2X6F6_SERVB|nr:hypothetical protein M408DRAFT_326307 [Serendipita vermifera MAFF 305830]